jgi:hypothetical protein
MPVAYPSSYPQITGELRPLAKPAGSPGLAKPLAPVNLESGQCSPEFKQLPHTDPALTEFVPLGYKGRPNDAACPRRSVRWRFCFSRKPHLPAAEVLPPPDAPANSSRAAFEGDEDPSGWSVGQGAVDEPLAPVGQRCDDFL